MKMHKTILVVLVLVAIGMISSAVGAAGNSKFATPTFSIDFQSLTNGLPDTWFGRPIAPDDILSPALAGAGPPVGSPAAGPLPAPGIAYGAMPLSPPTGLGLGYMFPGELDALSYGRDDYSGGLLPDIWHFSVDRFAAGIPTMTSPDVFTEGVLGNCEAAADVFKNWFPLSWNNTAYTDGNGIAPSGALGVGLIELGGGLFPDPGAPKDDDDLDALDIDTTVVDVSGNMPIYFSLDARFQDPLDMIGNTGSAGLNGFVGGDIMVSVGGTLGMYAAAAQLGLDLEGVDSDDLDALVLVEDGDGIYQPALDFVAFSVRRGSGVIGMIDSLIGIPISEGDILVPPKVGAAGPGILVRAEWLGLATMRSGADTPYGFDDDLNALDVRTPLLGDTNDDGVVDIVDLTALAANWFNLNPPWWTSGDYDGNGVIDIVDLTALAANWGLVGDPPPVPEPVTVALLSVGCLALLRRRRK